MSKQLSIAEAALQLLLIMPSVKEAQDFTALCIPDMKPDEACMLWHRRISAIVHDDGNRLMLENSYDWLAVETISGVTP